MSLHPRSISFTASMATLIEREPVRACIDFPLAASEIVLDRTPAGTLFLSGDVGKTLHTPRDKAEVGPPLRRVDIEAQQTMVDFSDASESDYASVAFSSLWRLARSARVELSSVCGIVSVLDTTLIEDCR